MSEEGDEDYTTIKVILLGETTVGKTSLINVYFGKKFQENIISTSMPESERKILEINKNKYLIEMMDTAGQERYRSMNNLFIKGSKVVIFVYDITKEQTFNELNYWVKTAKGILNTDAVYGIAENKADLIDDIKVSDGEGKKYAKENDAMFCTTSAKEDSKGFQMFVDQLVKQYIEKNIDKSSNEKNGKKISIENTKKKSKCC